MLWQGEAERIFCPSLEGDLGIHAEHTPLLTGVCQGQIEIKVEDGEYVTFVVKESGRSLIEVLPYRVRIFLTTIPEKH